MISVVVAVLHLYSIVSGIKSKLFSTMSQLQKSKTLLLSNAAISQKLILNVFKKNAQLSMMWVNTAEFKLVSKFSKKQKVGH